MCSIPQGWIQGLYDMHSDSNQSVQSGYLNYTGGPAVPGASDTTILNKILSVPWFSGTEREKDTVLI